MARVCDFVNLFATVNQQLVKEEGKVAALLADSTERLVRIEALIREVRVIPVK